MISQRQATAIGCIAIVLWSLDTLLNIQLQRLSVIQVLATTWMLSFFQYAIVLCIRQEWHKVKQPPLVWLIGSLGICGAHWSLVLALRKAPAAQVTAFSALWPIFVVAIGGFLFHQKRIWLSLLGAIIGFIGVWLVLTEGNGFKGYHIAYTFGYLLALFSCLLWSGYVVMTRTYASITSEMMGMYLGVGGLFALTYHLFYEPYTAPSATEWLLLIVKGCLTLSASYFCWDFAIKRGHFALLNVLAYFNPLLTLILLSTLGFAAPIPGLWLGVVLVTIASLICSEVIRKKIP